MTDTSLLSIIPNLGIGVVAILCLGYITKVFLEQLNKRAEAHEAAMTERETALRAVEKDMRGTLATLIVQANSSINENTRVLHRVINHLDRASTP